MGGYDLFQLNGSLVQLSSPRCCYRPQCSVHQLMNACLAQLFVFHSTSFINPCISGSHTLIAMNSIVGEILPRFAGGPRTHPRFDLVCCTGYKPKALLPPATILPASVSSCEFYALLCTVAVLRLFFLMLCLSQYREPSRKAALTNGVVACTALVCRPRRCCSRSS